MTFRRNFLAFLGAHAAVVFSPTSAQSRYPNRPIKFIVPFPPGGNIDFVARAIAQPMGQALGQPVLIDYKPGADGLIAGEVVAKSSPDGYTFMFGGSTGMSFAPAAHKSMPYDVLTDFTPVGRIGTVGFFVYVHADVPAKTFAELVSYARANPGKLHYGSGNATSMVTTAQITKANKMDMVHIPYKGDAPLFLDIVAGRVQVAVGSGVALPFVQDGKLRALATLMANRSPLLPDVPTLVETGMPEIPNVPWSGLFGPAKLPREVTDRVSRELSQVLTRSDVREQLGKVAFECHTSSPEELATLAKDQLAIWAKASRDAGVWPE